MLEFFDSIPLIWMAVIAGIFTWAVTALGAAVVFFFKKIKKIVLDGMLGFAAGVMIAASFWSLLSPGIEMADNMGMISWVVASLGFTFGGIILGADYLFKKKEDIKVGFRRSALLIFSITAHNIPEGFAIGVAFGSVAYNIEGASLISAMVLSLGIGLQNFPEGLAVSVPLRREGFSRKKAFFFGQLSGIVEPISAIVGFLLVTHIQNALPFLLCLAAGSMIFVVVSELIPESQQNSKKNVMTLFTMIGFIVMMILDIGLK